MPKGRVLVWENEESVRRMIVTHLQRAGYECAIPPSVDAVRETLALGNVDVVTTCWQGLGGQEVVSIAQPSRPNIPILCISGWRADEIRDVDAILTKPYEPQELLAEVGRLIGGHAEVVQ